VEFLLANSELLIVISIVIGILVLGFFLMPYLKRKGVIKDSDAQLTGQLIEIVKLVIMNTQFKDDKTKDQTLLIFEICNTVVRYIEQSMRLEDSKDKKEKAYLTVLEILAELDIEVTEQRRKLIEVGIESAVNLLPPTHK
jgi:hypothetical protein